MATEAPTGMRAAATSRSMRRALMVLRLADLYASAQAVPAGSMRRQALRADAMTSVTIIEAEQG